MGRGQDDETVNGKAKGTMTLSQSGTLRGTVLPPAEDAATAAARWEPVRPLGAGAMGEVELVRDHDIGRTVAVKRPIDALDGHRLARFAREVRTIGKLEHPGIVPIHDVGIDDEGRHYFVMKYVEGETLASVIAKLQAGDAAYLEKYTHEARTALFMQLLQAVKFAHARGVLHRDIKPDNIMVGPFGEVMLMDWGIARELGSDGPETVTGGSSGVSGPDGQTLEGSLVGTLSYMSPEQSRGEIGKLDERSDLYSLTVVFHELVTLRHYLSGYTSGAAKLAAIGDAGDRSFAEWMKYGVDTETPPELIHFLRRGMKKSPADRYQSIDEMLDTLDRVRDHHPYIQCHLTFTKRVLGLADHAVNRHPLVATAFVALFVLALVAAAVAGVVHLVGHA